MKVQNRLDFVLKKKADQGVKVYVLPWSETKIAIDLASANVKSYLGPVFAHYFLLNLLFFIIFKSRFH